MPQLSPTLGVAVYVVALASFSITGCFISFSSKPICVSEDFFSVPMEGRGTCGGTHVYF
uniref:ATP synthase F0 subunit 8 n=1 Tax=Lissachatina fulica TaxID=2315439 RepID=A0A097J9K3_LISFU|nr:ATP synthase F0 subunit 8 [Lissachatina fulica]AIE43758.1 ATP synthase F0 subunit 8 [Lissachatina fulica]AIT76131.1 ATP synthase F0 subunit 8 [Lissachatina fulica]WJZ52997.1 ATP synthase F0 subunit 8 [Lissachatina fulica]